MTEQLHLDTHVVIWLAAGDTHRFPPDLLHRMESADLVVSPVVRLEMDLLNERGEIDELNLKMIFYQEGKINNFTVRFQYEFTQNQGLDDEATHLKAFDYNIKVRA